MDSATKDSITNIFTLGGIGLTMAQIQTSLSVLVLLTALVLNLQRIFDWWKERK